jgi:pSer/pThr/pTyr-binding forkhead associated (FHA) protein
MAYVTIRIKEVEGHTTADLLSDRVVVGRSSSCGLPIRHDSISREHCAFVREGDAWFIEDLGSANGTKVNSERVSGRRRLEDRDIVKIGKARLTVHLGERRSTEAGAAIRLDASTDDGIPVRELQLGDPLGAINCRACHAWFSVAHRLPGERMACPRCGTEQTVPTLVTPALASP